MRKSTNVKIRAALLRHGVTQYELAKKFNVSETTMYKWLRDELPEKDQQGYIEIIRQLAKEKAAEHATAQD